DHGITGVGVDLNPPFIAAARARAAELGVEPGVRFEEANAAGWVSEHPVAVASCCGATWIGGGVEGTLDLLSRSLAPNGVALVGEPFWREIPPTAEAARASAAESADSYSTLPELIDRMSRRGWDVVEMVLADEDSWDRYVAAQWLNIRRFIDANPHDEIVPQLRSELDSAPARYVEYQRRYLGWGVFALMRR
ncbi:MAG TPA: SAM-dependent methyltransferase, partial [Mycobacteriales bacterium]|nr:SAM-dependent methyltransferase [Mycobacteriales bacterium]